MASTTPDTPDTEQPISPISALPCSKPIDMASALTQEFEKLSACIHCGMCLPVCPTYRVTGSEAESPRGRLYLMNAYVHGRLEDPKALATHLDPCLGCQACVTACPSGVKYGDVLMASRQLLVKHQHPWYRRWRRFLLQKVLPNARLLNILAEIAWFYQQSGIQAVMRRYKLWRLGGPLGKLEQFMPRLQAARPLKTGQVFGTNQAGRVALFTGCIMNAAFAKTHQSTIEVLVRNGYEVFVPSQTCCGALAHHSGETDIAQTLAQENIAAILAHQPDWIVNNAAGCGSTLKEYAHLLGDTPESQAFAQKTVDIMELLAQKPLAGHMHPVHLKVAYHAACHLHHAQQVQTAPVAVLSQVPGLTLVPLTEAEMCCGSAGVYNLAHPDLSLQILEQKMTHLAQTEADVVLAGNPGCMLQLETGVRNSHLDMRVMHPVDLLALSYRGGYHRGGLHVVDPDSEQFDD